MKHSRIPHTERTSRTSKINRARPAALRIASCLWADEHALVVKVVGGVADAAALAACLQRFAAMARQYRPHELFPHYGVVLDLRRVQVRASGRQWANAEGANSNKLWFPMIVVVRDADLKISEEYGRRAVDHGVLRVATTSLEVGIWWANKEGNRLGRNLALSVHAARTDRLFQSTLLSLTDTSKVHSESAKPRRARKLRMTPEFEAALKSRMTTLQFEVQGQSEEEARLLVGALWNKPLQKLLCSVGVVHHQRGAA